MKDLLSLNDLPKSRRIRQVLMEEETVLLHGYVFLDMPLHPSTFHGSQD
jgi:hypothetical protein